MDKKRTRLRWTDLTLLVIGLVYFTGMLSFLSACGPKEDGSWMTCHWACQALRGAAGAMLALAILRLLSGPQVRVGLDIGSIVLALLAICIPGRLIGLCMMSAMRCHTVMVPGTLVASVLTILAAAVDLLIQRKKG